MRYSASEKAEIILLVENSPLPLKRTLQQLGISRSTWYNWYDRYLEDGIDGLNDKKPIPKSVWNKIPSTVKNKIITLALKKTGFDNIKLKNRPRLLSDNGSSYISSEHK